MQRHDFEKHNFQANYDIQKTVMPSPSAAELGNVYQYIGETTADFTHGYFYECVHDDGAYTWRRIDVQPGGGQAHPYLSLERLRKYLYRVTFDALPEDDGGDSPVTGGCSSFVQGGKLYRNLDFNYDNAASFIVRTRDFEGMSFMTGLDDGNMDDDLIAQLPYRIVDGRNNDGIMVSAHVLFNDWQWTGVGDRSISLTRLPYMVLSRVKSMATIAADLNGVLGNLYAVPSLQATGYLLQVLVTDGTTTYALMPPTSEGQDYVLQDITFFPKLTNFRWLAQGEVSRYDMDMQTRPTGIERYNLMPCNLEDLRFTKAYETDGRLSEFIGIGGTTKSSSDADLEAIYNEARAEYLTRQRDGKTWQTMHSVVYGSKMEELHIQEDWSDNIISSSGKWGGIGGDIADQTDLQAALDRKVDNTTLLAYGDPFLSYGVEFDTAVSSPTCTRIGNMSLHSSLPIQSRMKGCLLNDDGEVVEYLDPDDWRGQTRDGSRGQVMVEIPMHYRRFETEGTKRRVKLSEFPLPGYHAVPKRYVSAYQATVQRSANKLASVANNTADYRGCDNQTAWDGTYRTALGRPATNISLTNYRTYARNRKSGSTKWNCHTYGTQKAIYWLFVVEYATLNSQAAYNAAKDASGYAQGGLGDGVTNTDGTAWNNFNGYHPFAPCGYTDEFGNGSGVKALEVRNGDDALFISTYVNRYRGIEIPFGHIHHWTDGVLVEAGAESGTNLNKVFVANDPAKFASSIGDGYAHVGNQARSDGYGKEHIFGEGGEIIAAAVGGGSTTYLCDYNFIIIPASGKATRGVLFGGRAHFGAHAGFVCALSTLIPSGNFAYVGSRLCFLPTRD